MESKFALRNDCLKTLKLWPYRLHERSKRERERALDPSFEKKVK